jgi:hypothetical protein
MNKTKRNLLILIGALLVLTAFAFDLSLQKETEKFEEFSIEVPAGTSFGKVIENDTMVKEMYRCYGEDLTVTSFDKAYIEDTYYENTGKHIDFAESLLKNMSGSDNAEVNKISKNLTQIIQRSNVNGYSDTDVACIYHDDDHVIIVEGGDVDFITGIAESVRIL